MTLSKDTMIKDAIYTGGNIYFDEELSYVFNRKEEAYTRVDTDSQCEIITEEIEAFKLPKPLEQLLLSDMSKLNFTYLDGGCTITVENGICLFPLEFMIVFLKGIKSDYKMNTIKRWEDNNTGCTYDLMLISK